MKKISFVHALIICIGVCGTSLGFANTISYITGLYKIKILYGEVPMAFDTSVTIFFYGLAFFIIGKLLSKYEKTI